MKKYFKKMLGIGILASSLLFASCVGSIRIGGSEIITIASPFDIIEGAVQWPQQNFTSLNISFPVNVYITENMGDTLLSFRMDSRLVDVLNVYVQGGALNIRPDRGVGISFGSRQIWDDMVIYINADAMRDSVTISGSSTLHLGSFETDGNFTLRASGSTDVFGSIIANRVDLTLSGASDAILDVYSAQETRIVASGSSDVVLSGASQTASLNISGASNIDLRHFAVNDVDIRASGSSDVIVNALNNLDINASGASRIDYIGTPNLRSVNTSGASSIRQID